MNGIPKELLLSVGGALLCAFVVSFLMCPLVKSFAYKIGAIDVPKDNRRMHKKPVPRLGGLAIFLGFIVSMLLFVKIDHQLKGILLGASIIVVLGVVDDMSPLRAYFKFCVQIFAALVAVFHGVVIQTLSNPNVFAESPYWDLGWLSIPITVLWIVGITNAVNLIDRDEGADTKPRADGGTGKGIWQAQLVAYVTAGKTSGFFPQPPGQTGRVLIFAGEDDPSKVLKARLMAAGADMSRVMVQTSDAYFSRTGNPLCIPDKSFAKYIESAAPALVLIDPLQSFLPAGVEMVSRNQMRAALLPLKALCARLGCAALIAMHTNKRSNVSGRARLADSSDIWDIARSVLMMGRDKNSGQLYLSHEKSSYAAPARTALLHIEQTQVEGVTTAVAVFDSRTDKKDADFVEERRVRVAQTKADAAQAILDVLAEAKLGSMPNTQLRAEVVRETGCSEKTYNRAYGELVKSGEIKKQQLSQQDGARGWYTFLGHWGGTNDQVAI